MASFFQFFSWPLIHFDTCLGFSISFLKKSRNFDGLATAPRQIADESFQFVEMASSNRFTHLLDCCRPSAWELSRLTQINTIRPLSRIARSRGQLCPDTSWFMIEHDGQPRHSRVLSQMEQSPQHSGFRPRFPARPWKSRRCRTSSRRPVNQSAQAGPLCLLAILYGNPPTLFHFQMDVFKSFLFAGVA